MFLRAKLAFALFAAALLGASAASALTYTPVVTIGRVGGTTWDMLDPVNATSELTEADGVAHWRLVEGYDFVKANYTVSDWTIDLKEDPFVTNNLTITNTGPVTSTFVATVMLPIPAFAYNTVIASSIGFTVTDSNSDGAIFFDAAAASTVYNGFVGFPVSTTLLGMDPTFMLGAPTATFPVNALSDCFPPIGTGCSATGTNGVASLGVAPGVATVIGLTLAFQLGAGDSVGITSRFEIANVVPEPTTLSLLGVAGLGVVALARRRSA
jgi:hypothetical protein